MTTEALFKPLSTADITAIRTGIRGQGGITMKPVNIFDPVYSTPIDVQAPNTSQMYYPINFNNGNTIACPTSTSTQSLTFTLPSVVGHSSHVISTIAVTVGGVRPVGTIFQGVEQYPWLWFTNFNLFFNSTRIYNQVDPIWFLPYMFAKMDNRLRDYLLLQSNDQADMDGTVTQLFFWPTPWDPILNGGNPPPLPVRPLASPLTFQFDTRPAEKWIYNYNSVGPVYAALTNANPVSVTMNLMSKSTVFQTVHNRHWKCLFEAPIQPAASALTFAANTLQSVQLNTIADRSLKAYAFVSVPTANLTTLPYKYFENNMATKFQYNPQGGNVYNLTSQAMVVAMMLTQWKHMQFYTGASPVIPTWRNFFFLAFGSVYDPNEDYGTYKFTGNDQSTVQLQYSVATTMQPMGIALQGLCLVGSNVDFDNSQAQLLWTFGNSNAST